MVCVAGSLPISLPMLLAIGIAVRVTSRGPVLFRQKRMGRNGKEFTIFKFRTMPVHDCSSDRPAVTTNGNQEFTSVGPFLRRFKLDELPNLFNVLRGDMSLVGPRPKLPQHQPRRLHCRPGITGRATVVFAREEEALTRIPVEVLEVFYQSVILPLKQKLDNEYMANATFASDFKLLVISVLRSWSDHELSAIATRCKRMGEESGRCRSPGGRYVGALRAGGAENRDDGPAPERLSAPDTSDKRGNASLQFSAGARVRRLQFLPS